jgi:hypothetical protein
VKTVPDKQQRSYAFPDGGIYVLRTARIYVAVVCHRIGVNGVGPHKHNDWLSFELCVNGQPIIIDPGTYCYTGDIQARRQFRSTVSHNTVVVDRTEQIPIHDCDFGLMSPVGESRVLLWESNEEVVLLEAEHTGYTRLTHSVLHRRRFLVDKLRNKLEITDTFLGEGEHCFEWYFHLDIGLECHIEGRSILIYNDGQPISRIELQGDVNTCHVQTGWVSKAYNRREPSKILYLNRQVNTLQSSSFRVRFSRIETPDQVQN